MREEASQIPVVTVVSNDSLIVDLSDRDAAQYEPAPSGREVSERRGVGSSRVGLEAEQGPISLTGTYIELEVRRPLTRHLAHLLDASVAIEHRC